MNLGPSFSMIPISNSIFVGMVLLPCWRSACRDRGRHARSLKRLHEEGPTIFGRWPSSPHTEVHPLSPYFTQQ